MNTYNYQTHSRTILGDLHTPVSTYLKVRDVFPQSALMESSDYHGSENNRSFIGLCPLASVSIDHGTAIFRLPDGTREERPITQEYPVEKALEDFLGRFHVEGEYANYCGLYGYTSFNAVRYFENIPVKDSREATNDAPDMLYILYQYLIVFNDFKNEMVLLEMLAPGEESELDTVQKAINNRNYTAYDFRAVGETTSPLTDEQHKANIRQGIAHCLRGDVFQIVLSRRFEQRFVGDDFKLYRALRSINPSPYLFYFDFGGFRIFGSSPETHCRIEGRHAYIDPIAGTTKRTGDPATDERNARYLRDNPKENAEHVMLVDLGRNDLGRIARPGTVNVERLMEVERFSHVMHLTSRITARLQPDLDALDVLAATFPAGTVSGAPKVRAMEIIAETEQLPRGPYAGCIGWLGLDDDNVSLDTGITIRSMWVKDGKLHWQAGGGIVFDSDPVAEWNEVYNKSAIMRTVLNTTGEDHVPAHR